MNRVHPAAGSGFWVGLLGWAIAFIYLLGRTGMDKANDAGVVKDWLVARVGVGVWQDERRFIPTFCW